MVTSLVCDASLVSIRPGDHVTLLHNIIITFSCLVATSIHDTAWDATGTLQDCLVALPDAGLDLGGVSVLEHSGWRNKENVMWKEKKQNIQISFAKEIEILPGSRRLDGIDSIRGSFIESCDAMFLCIVIFTLREKRE